MALSKIHTFGETRNTPKSQTITTKGLKSKFTKPVRGPKTGEKWNSVSPAPCNRAAADQ